MKKRLLALLLMLSIAVSCLPIGVWASDNTKSSESSMTLIYVESASCIKGQTVQVNICVANNPGIAGATLSVSFDPALTLTNASVTDSVFKDLSYTEPSKLENPCVFNWDSLNEVATEDGTILTLTFEVSNDVAIGSKLEINVSCEHGDIYDVSLNSIAVMTAGGSLNVNSYRVGDANSDTVINGKDITLIRRYNAGWDVDIHLLAADANGDGALNGKDVTILRRYLAGWDISFGCAHNILAVEAKDPTCTEPGNKAYWHCTSCQTYFTDEKATTQTALADITLPPQGHTEEELPPVAPDYDKDGLTAGLWCTVCQTILVQQESIPQLQPDYYSITYSNLFGATAPELKQYASHLGVSDTEMPKPERHGYQFEGWYTSNEFIAGTKISDIPSGTTQNYHLYAKWSIIEYTITYQKAPSHSNPTTYTVEDSFVLTDPRWSGLAFVNWTDDNGNPITMIEKGTIGNLTLTANWRSHENLVVPSQNSTTVGEYLPEQQKYLFIFELGTIYNVVLDTTMDLYRKTTDAPRKIEISQTFLVEENRAQTVAQSIATSIASSENWNNIISNKSINSTSQSLDFNGELGVGSEASIVKGKLSATYGVTFSNSNEHGWETAYGRSEQNETENSQTLENSISYTQQMSISTTVTDEITGTMPDGDYFGVHAADIRIFAIVIYDPIKDEYNFSTYSSLEYIHDMILYRELYSSNEANNNYDSLSFTIDTDRINNLINSSFHIVYDANGGEGEMPISLHSYDAPGYLPQNAYTKEGSVFIGWEYSDGEKVVLLADKADINGLVTNNPDNPKPITIVLKAIWTDNTYSIRYDANGADNGQMESTLHTYSDEFSLSKNEYTKTGYVFIGWNTAHDGSGKSFADQESVSKLTANMDAVTLYAQWKANNYTITYHANGGSGSTYTSSHTYDVSTSLSANNFSRHGWTFAGWSTSPNGSVAYKDTAQVFNLTSQADGKVDLYAVWTIISSANFTPSEKNVNEDAPYPIGIDLNSTFDLSGLKAQGFTKAVVTVTYDISYIKSAGHSYVLYGIRDAANSNELILGRSENIEFNKNSSPKDQWAGWSTSIDQVITHPKTIVQFNATMDFSPFSNNEHTISHIRIQIYFTK